VGGKEVERREERGREGNKVGGSLNPAMRNPACAAGIDCGF